MSDAAGGGEPQVVELGHSLSGEGPSVVLIHGITEDRRTWDPVIDDLAGTHQVLAVDLRGHGASPMADAYDLGSMAADIQALVERLGLQAPLLVGHSLGGTVATAYAASYLTRAVINVDQPLDLVGFQAQVREVESVLRSDDFAVVIEQLFASMRGPLPEPEVERVGSIRTPRQDVVLGVWSPVLDLSAERLGELVDEVASAVTAPYLSLHGIDPGPGYAEWLAERLPHAQVEVWADHGHYPHLVAPERFLQRLRDVDPATWPPGRSAEPSCSTRRGP